MNTVPIVPARIVADDDGTPRSVAHGDVYHPRSGALAQARHVFLENGALAARWRGRERFVVLETGFGLGNNFLATWAAWRGDKERCERLHFVSVEQSPPDRATLEATPRDPALGPQASELVQRWPPLTCNLHRVAFDVGRVELLLAFGPAAAWLPQLVAEVDAFFLDGFAPALNPEMWELRLFKAMARLAAPGATVATWSAARAVRDHLAAAGFAVELAAGNGGKRDITRACFAPRAPARAHPRGAARGLARLAPAAGRDHAVVIVGAGLAGCALANALARRGVRSLVVERNSGVAAEASGNAAGIFHGVVHRHDGRHARFHRAAALAAAAAVREAIERHGVRGSAGGLLRLETRLDVEAMRAIVTEQGMPLDYVEPLDTAAASEVAGIRLASPAWHYPSGGWVDPHALAQAWLASAGDSAALRLGAAVASLRHSGDGWRVCDGAGATIAAAQAVVLCDGSGGADLPGMGAWPLRRQRGEISALPEQALPPDALPRLPLAGHGHVLPGIAGAVWFGTSTRWDNDGRAATDAGRFHNVDRLTALLGLPGPPAIDALAGRAAVRWLAADRLPLVGAVPAAVAEAVLAGGPAVSSTRLDQPRFVARAPGLFVLAALGSRGIAAASLGAEILGALIAGSPVPAEADLIDAVDPARFLSREFRRGEATLAARADQPPVGPIAGPFGG